MVAMTTPYARAKRQLTQLLAETRGVSNNFLMSTAQNGRAEREPFQPICACASARGMSRAVTQLYEACLAPVGLKATQFIILQTIARYGEVPQWELAKHLTVAVDTLTRRLASLRREELLSMRKGRHNQERIYRLTDKGRARLAQAEPHWERAQLRLRSTLGEERWHKLLSITAETARAAGQALNAPMVNCARAAK